MIALVRGVIAASSLETSIFAVSSSTSTNTGLPPMSTIISAVAAKVNGVVTTSSPGLIPSAISAISRASVPEATARQCLAPVYAARRSSSSFTSGPMMYCPWSSTFWMRALIGSRRAAYWVLRSMKSMRLPVGGAHLALEFLDFALQPFVFLQLALEEADRSAHFLLRALGREVIGVDELVTVVAEVAYLEQPLVQQRVQAEVDFPHAHVQLPGELALGEFGIRLQQLEQAITGFIVEHEGKCGVRSMIERRIRPAPWQAVKRWAVKPA